MNGTVRLTPDMAFCFPSERAEVEDRLLSNLRVDGPARPLIGVVPNMRVYQRMPGTGKGSSYVHLMADVIRRAWNLGALAVLIPHEISFARDPRDDRFLCRLIRDVVGNGGPLAILDGMYSAGEIKCVIRRLDLLVGSRFHSIVAALSCRVPAVVLGWSHKYVELMRLVGLEDLVLDCHSETDSLLDRLEVAWADRAELRSQLEARVPAIEHDTERLFDVVAAVIRRRAR